MGPETQLLAGSKDASKPIPSDELARIKTAVYPSLPSYKAEDGTIAAEDIPELYNRMNWPRTEKQIRVYQRYWNRHFGGRAPWAVLEGILSKVHTTGGWVREYIKAVDKSCDGFLQRDEFELFWSIFALHYPSWKVSYDEFRDEADLNRDGMVSIEEAVLWVEKHKPAQA